LTQSGSSSDRPFAELGRDLVCHTVKFTATLAVGLVKEVVLRPAGAVEVIDAKAE
jgi:hypothetical protein